MKPEEINIPKNYVDKTDEMRNKLIRDMFPIVVENISMSK